MKTNNSIHLYDYHSTPGDIKKEILIGLHAKQKYIAPKYFYDAPGSQLFDQICLLPEYYLTRTETGLLKKHRHQIAKHLGLNTVLLELGSGSSDKIRLLLNSIRPISYVPIDISKNHLVQSANLIAEDFPWLEIHALCVDYNASWNLPQSLSGNRRIAFFPGSSIGNLAFEQAVGLLSRLVELVGDKGGLLIGVDLIKDIDILEAAYNDIQGVTARFNKNLLVRLNRELNANFNIEQFQHRAFYNQEQDRIEMHLESSRDQFVQIAGQKFRFRKGETIHTENSHKYSIFGFHKMALQAGFHPVKVWTDAHDFFSIHYLQTVT